MNRKDFFKGICKYGLCSCAVFAVVSNEKAFASSDDEDQEVKTLKWKLEFINKRFAKLLDIMDVSIDDAKKREMLEKLGRECAKEYDDNVIKFRGDVEGFLEDVMRKWVERAEYDKDKGLIQIYDKKREACFCPFIERSLVSSDTMCHCSVGWQKHIYETLTGKKVEVEVTGSILKGGEQCSFNIFID
jgi:predicted hydrocarbon binding protein